ncbi:hypothetical protein ARMSODRAFT_967634 [Armillaria solidipes]|uniref:Uncharacterized protein n=1 Tax=Armillaria solidipes TaxID=1076256 RepID=A0A2H3AHW9_9AGAR|nr:hypothetical protein ARMSODRAFT_967634 [Armillaria solidipes]
MSPHILSIVISGTFLLANACNLFEFISLSMRSLRLAFLGENRLCPNIRGTKSR